MLFVREELARTAVEAFRAATEWPHNAVFLMIRTYDCFAIASGAVTHADLFLILKDSADQRNLGNHPLQRTDDIFDGHVEWEMDGTYFARTHGGKTLPSDLDALLRSELDRLMQDSP
jgi:hypothetical protein